MSTHLIDRLIQNFSTNNLISFLGSKLLGFQGQHEDYSYFLTDNQRAKYSDVYKIGETTINDSEFIIAIVAKTIDSLTERSGKKTQYDIAKTILKDERADLAFFVFYDVDGNFRFSIIDVERENNQSHYSTYKRYSYYVSKEQTNKTFRNQVGDSNFTSIEEIVKAFSVEKLNRQFYDELSNWYFWATQCVTYPDDEEKKEDIRNATNVIRLITRLIFVWFLKQKNLVPDELFDKDKIDEILNYSDKTGSTYYKAILQNLFFATLNTEMTGNKRKFVHRQSGVQGFYRYERFFSNKDYFLELTQNIPFLNGGLFENLDREIDLPNGEKQIIRIDCFSNRRDLEEKLVVPDYLFFGETTGVNLNEVYGDKNHTDITISGLIDILKRYNFTIEENNPIEIEVALDPELLGKAFENLLASYNPETQTTARKQSGSFYTPREIVDYMCDESLYIYLKEVTQDSIPEVKLRNLIAYKSLETNFTDIETDQLIEAIDNCKILDPACGSGAFPMGVLQKMVFILQKLDPENKKWKSIQKERAKKENKELIEKLEKDKELINQISSLPELKSQALVELDLRLKQIEDAFSLNTNELDYARKLFLIENCIYGIDIQPIAIQISKLRFFISLLVEQIVDNDLPNRGIVPMPNMETKFVAANTLVTLSKDNLIKPVSLYPLEAELKDVRNKHFSARTPETKKKYRHEDKRLRKEIGEILKDSGFPPTSAQQIANWNPYDQNASAGWFDSEWMFGILDGFDIVIGNPPYVQLQKDGGKLAKQYEKQKFDTFERTGDIYSLFYEKGLELLAENRFLMYITSNKWMRANYGASTRQFFAEKAQPILLIDFGNIQVFETATVDTNILLLKKPPKSKKVNSQQLYAVLMDKGLDKNNIASYVKENAYVISAVNQNAWVVGGKDEFNIKEFIEQQGLPLSKWDVQIYRGILTGYNDAFIISGKEKNRLIEEDYKSEDILKPLLRGKDISAWYPDFQDYWLINSHNGVKQKGIERIDVKKDYPAVYKWLLQFETKLERRTDKGDTWANLRNCAYIKDFEKPKIVYVELSKYLPFVYDDGYFFIDKTCFMILGNNLKYLTCFLNSKLYKFCFSNNFSILQGGTKVQSKVFFEKIPVKPITKELEVPFARITDYLVALKKENSSEPTDKFMFNYFEQIADALVFEYYFEGEFKNNNLFIAKYIKELSELEIKNNILVQLRKTFVEINRQEHPIRQSLYRMLTIPQVELIIKNQNI